jgi:integrase
MVTAAERAATRSGDLSHNAEEVDSSTFHTLRHTCATRLFELGLNAKQVQVWLGHHSPAFTMATYVHLLSDDLPASPFGQLHAHLSKDAPESTDRTDRLLAADRSQG